MPLMDTLMLPTYLNTTREADNQFFRARFGADADRFLAGPGRPLPAGAGPLAAMVGLTPPPP